jgi:hypothetical protein
MPEKTEKPEATKLVEGSADDKAGRVTEEPKKPDVTKLSIRELIGGLTIPQVAAAISTLVGMVAASFALGYHMPHQSTETTVKVHPQPPDLVKVVFVDTDKRVYDKRYGRSNADFLTSQAEKLKDLLTPEKKITGSLSPEDVAKEVKKEEPDIVVIHRSAFYGDRETDPDEAKLERFLREMAGLDIIFVLYSRKGDTDGKYAADMENKSTLIGKIYAYKFTSIDSSKNPFKDKAQVDHFFNTISLLAHARLDLKKGLQRK